jgi:uncharacterized DUF497 family protein
MDVEFDPAKDAANVATRGLSLAQFAGFDAAPAAHALGVAARSKK